MIDVREKGQALPHYWSKCVGAGRANEGLRAEWQRQLKLVVKECEFEYIRFHGLFHDDMFVYREIEGVGHFNFQYIDELFDFLLSIGIRPFVELSFMPSDMASGDDTFFWWKCNITPPKSYDLWCELITKFLNHYIHRYGIDEVRKWYFEVWNEPSLTGAFWSSTKTEYFRLYKETVLTIKAVDTKLKVGGPATNGFMSDTCLEGEVYEPEKQEKLNKETLNDREWKPVWIDDFIRFCSKEQLPVDFISAHPYPTSTALDNFGHEEGYSREVESTSKDMKQLKEVVGASPYPKAEIHLTEWNSSPSPRDFAHDFSYSAPFIIKANLDGIGMADSLVYWAFTDIFEENGAGNKAFHGGFGMINYQGIKKPTFHAYRFLNKLGNRILEQKENYIISKNSSNNRVTALLYNYNLKDSAPFVPTMEEAEKVNLQGEKQVVKFSLKGFESGTKFISETIDERHCAMKIYQKLGNPSSLHPTELNALKAITNHGEIDFLQADNNGNLSVEQNMNKWSMIFIQQI